MSNDHLFGRTDNVYGKTANTCLIGPAPCSMRDQSRVALPLDESYMIKYLHDRANADDDPDALIQDIRYICNASP